MNDNGAARGGLFASLRQLIATALELAQVRLELLGTEIEEQKLHILAALVWAAVGVLLVGLGLVLLACCMVLLVGEAYRLHAVAVLTVTFLLAGVLALRRARARLTTPGGVFTASAAELARDRDALGASTDPRESP